MITRLRAKWQDLTGDEDTPFDGDAGAWLISLSFHFVVLVGLTLVLLTMPEPPLTMRVSVDPTETEPIVEPINEIRVAQFAEEVGATGPSSQIAATTEAPLLAEEIHLRAETPESPTDFSRFEPDAHVAASPTIGNRILGRGVAATGASGAIGAVDRITQEILASLEQRTTLVVWLFDASPSMRRQRAEINGRFEQIYRELGVLESRNFPALRKHSADSQPLLTSIVSFGGKPTPTFLTPNPSGDYAEIRTAVDSIADDPSGLEMTFSAVQSAAERHLRFRQQGRNVMLVVVTDEAANDAPRIEETLATVRRYEMPVYVIGVPAPFGHEYAPVKYVNTDPNYAAGDYWIRVRQGPESARAELVRLAFWGQSRDQVDAELLDSGFGPFHLTRLCYETGGIYFAVHNGKAETARAAGRAGARYTEDFAARIDKFFDPRVMRAYAPDYVPDREYGRLLGANKARSALVKAAEFTTTEALRSPRQQFPVEGPAELKQMLDEAQQSAATLEPKLAGLFDVLKTGEADRAKLSQPRWQAGFDLAMGRVLAAKVRTEGYNAMLAELKRGVKFANEKSDTWELVAADQITTGSILAKQADAARAYLERVVREHADTPWAYLAARELETPLGWKLEEKFTNVAGRKQAAADAAAAAAGMPVDKKKELPQKPRLMLKEI